MIIKNCEQCKKEFKTFPYKIKLDKGRFCSKKCFVIYQRGHNYMENLIGKKFNRLLVIKFHRSEKKNGFTEYTWLFKCDCGKEKLIRGNSVKSGFVKSCGCLAIEKSIIRNKERIGSKSATWKGDKVKYGGLHDWVRRHLGTPTKCEYCGKDGLIKSQIDWANKSHQYKRDLTDWLRLCRSCHRQYDFNLMS